MVTKLSRPAASAAGRQVQWGLPRPWQGVGEGPGAPTAGPDPGEGVAAGAALGVGEGWAAGVADGAGVTTEVTRGVARGDGLGVAAGSWDGAGRGVIGGAVADGDGLGALAATPPPCEGCAGGAARDPAPTWTPLPAAPYTLGPINATMITSTATAATTM